MVRYAKGTTVGVDRSKQEIERILIRYGADSFAYGWEQDRAMIQFQSHGKVVRMRLDLPGKAEFELTPTEMRRLDEAATRAWEQGVKERWRSLAMVIKSKLESVAIGIVTFEEEFLAHLCLPDGKPFGEWALPQIDEVYRTGEPPPMLPMLGEGESG